MIKDCTNNISIFVRGKDVFLRELDICSANNDDYIRKNPHNPTIPPFGRARRYEIVITSS